MSCQTPDDLSRTCEPQALPTLPRFGSLTRTLPEPGPEEVFETLLAHPAARIERIVSHRHASPPGFWYEQTEDEWVMLQCGEAVLAFENPQAECRLGPGDWVWLPAGCRHRVMETGPDTVWLAVHLPAATRPGRSGVSGSGSPAPSG